mmetsp:Transcript_51967/g.166395  ORF Transcript_51967/g.166395 Transcript_51967/m.166395 type:complete len:209 (-) Transcript_51967:741-1367(-)
MSLTISPFCSLACQRLQARLPISSTKPGCSTSGGCLRRTKSMNRPASATDFSASCLVRRMKRFSELDSAASAREISKATHAPFSLKPVQTVRERATKIKETLSGRKGKVQRDQKTLHQKMFALNCVSWRRSSVVSPSHVQLVSSTSMMMETRKQKRSYSSNARKRPPARFLFDSSSLSSPLMWYLGLAYALERFNMRAAIQVRTIVPE